MVVANRYGTIDKDGTSFTEKEFDLAVKLGIPVLAFLIEEGAPWPQGLFDKNRKAKQRLSAFKTKISDSRIIQYWKNKEELHSRVTTSLIKAIRDTQRGGWEKLDSRRMPDHSLYVKRSEILWKPFNESVSKRYWAAGTSLIGVFERNLLDTFFTRGVNDIRIIVPSTDHRTSSYRQLADYDRKPSTYHIHNQVHVAERSYILLKSKLSQLFPNREYSYLRRYDEVMYFNITVFDGNAFLAPYNSHGEGDNSLAIHFNEITNPEGYKYAIEEFERMWSPQLESTDLSKPKGTSVIFFDANRRVLLYRRDKKATIPFPNLWDLIGGTVQSDETPESCIARELLEELEYDRKTPQLFEIYNFNDRVEYTYYIADEIDISNTPLHEGQCLKWFTRKEIMRMPDYMFAFGFKRVLDDFYRLHFTNEET